jgi:hypothetical protein
VKRLRYFKNDTIHWRDPWQHVRIGTVLNDTPITSDTVPAVWNNSGKDEVAYVRQHEIFAVSGTLGNDKAGDVVSTSDDTDVLEPVTTVTNAPRRAVHWWTFWRRR